MTRKSVMDEIEKENEVHTIKIIGNAKDNSDGFYILINTQQISSTKKGFYHGVKNSTLELLRKAEIKFRITNDSVGGES